MLIDHDALKKVYLTQNVPYVIKATHVTDVELEETRGWLVTKMGVRGAVGKKHKHLRRMIEDQPETLPGWSRRA